MDEGQKRTVGAMLQSWRIHGVQSHNMKTTMPFLCRCGESLKVEATGTALPQDIHCPKCGIAPWFIPPLRNVVGLLALGRAHSELTNGDFTLTVILSAMAVECEMSRLFVKWNGIDQMRANQTGIMPTQAEEDLWIDEWRSFSRIKRRLDEVSKLLTALDFNEFISQNSGLLSGISGKYPGLKSQTPKDFFQQELFNKRNNVVHHGEIDFKKADGEMCFLLASALTDILKEMDNKRIAALDAAHEAERVATQ